MIGYLEGRVVASDGKKTTVATSAGVGYEFHYYDALTIGSPLKVYIHHHVSENDQSLWAFNTLEEKKVFELLKSVNKVGSSKAYPLVVQIGVAELLHAIKFERSEVLTKAPGIGKKMAEQIILSLKDKVDKFSMSFTVGGGEKFTDNALPLAEQTNETRMMYSEALMALESLGYKERDITAVLKAKAGLDYASSADLIKQVLKEL